MKNLVQQAHIQPSPQGVEQDAQPMMAASAATETNPCTRQKTGVSPGAANIEEAHANPTTASAIASHSNVKWYPARASQRTNGVAHRYINQTPGCARHPFAK